MSSLEAWGEAGIKYSIHPETLEYFRVVGTLGGKPLAESSVPQARESEIENLHILAGYVDFEGKLSEYIIPSPHGTGIPVTVYKPAKCRENAPIMVYFHGGVFVLGCRETVDCVCKSLAKAPCIVVNVEYRLAPEHKLPAALDDAVCATRWVNMNKALIGGSNASPLGAGGESVGAHLATTVCHEIPGIDFQVLVYPMTDLSCTHASMDEFATTPGANGKVINKLVKYAITSPTQFNDPRITPILRSEFAELPPALFILAELDPLRDCGYAYRDKLSEAGVRTELVLLKGVPHGFFRLPAVFKELCGQAYSTICHFINNYDDKSY